MVSKKIENLTLEDLNYLDKLLHTEFSHQIEKSGTWKSKHKYDDPCDETIRLRKIMDAVRSQKNVLTMPKW